MESIQKLKNKWALWETYIQDQSQKSSNLGYMENLNLIYECETLEDFALIWSNLPHSQPSTFFHEHGTRAFKK